MFAVKEQFDGSFGSKCQEESVPSSLLALVSNVLYGPNIKTQSSSSETPNREWETPLPIYVGTIMHAKTRKRELVDQLYDLGWSISYDHVLDISPELNNKICHYYSTQNAVGPPGLNVAFYYCCSRQHRPTI